MRQFICLVLVISLSWVTTGYACQMDGWSRVRAVCCCLKTHATPPPAKAKPCADQASAAAGTSCCTFMSSAGLHDQQPGLMARAAVLDLPVFVSGPPLTWVASEPRERDLALPPPARGPPGAGTHTFLTTARLRL